MGRIVIDTEGRVPGIRSIFARDRGGSPKRLHRRISGHVTGMALPMGIRKVPKEMTVGSSIGPTASECGCVSWKRGRVDLYVYGLNLVILTAGLMKPWRGFTLVAGEEKLGVGK